MSWEKGDPKPSLKKEILELLNEDKEKVWPLAEIRGALFSELDMPSEFDSANAQIEIIEITRTTATIEALLEILVEEGKVDKREFKIDQIARITINEQEYEELAEQWEGDVMSTQVFYRAADA